MIQRRATRPRLTAPSTDSVAKEGRPKFNDSTKPGTEHGTFWLVVRDLTNCANFAHTTLVGVQLYFMAWVRSEERLVG